MHNHLVNDNHMDIYTKNSREADQAEEHPTRRRDPTAFSFTVERAGERPLTRQMREAQKISNEAPGILINGRNEHIPPAARRTERCCEESRHGEQDNDNHSGAV